MVRGDCGNRETRHSGTSGPLVRVLYPLKKDYYSCSGFSLKMVNVK